MMEGLVSGRGKIGFQPHLREKALFIFITGIAQRSVLKGRSKPSRIMLWNLDRLMAGVLKWTLWY